MFTYRAYGLRIRSVFRLPELATEPFCSARDVVIRRGKVDRLPSEKKSSDHLFRATESETGFYWPDTGGVLVRNGRDIVVDPAPNVEERVLRSCILGSALGVLLQQRCFLALHASSVNMSGKAVLFMGGSHWGKSTMAAALQAHGHKLIADDVTAVKIDQGTPYAYPGFPQLKLWPDTAISLGKTLESLPKLHPRFEKRALRLTDPFDQTPVPLDRIYVLTENPVPTIEPIQGQEALMELVRHSFGLRTLKGAAKTAHLLQCRMIAQRMPILCFKRPFLLSNLQDTAKMIENDVFDKAL